jgi:hypothetical protein
MAKTATKTKAPAAPVARTHAQIVEERIEALTENDRLLGAGFTLDQVKSTFKFVGPQHVGHMVNAKVVSTPRKFVPEEALFPNHIGNYVFSTNLVDIRKKATLAYLFQNHADEEGRVDIALLFDLAMRVDELLTTSHPEPSGQAVKKTVVKCLIEQARDDAKDELGNQILQIGAFVVPEAVDAMDIDISLDSLSGDGEDMGADE